MENNVQSSEHTRKQATRTIKRRGYKPHPRIPPPASPSSSSSGVSRLLSPVCFQYADIPQTIHINATPTYLPIESATTQASKHRCASRAVNVAALLARAVLACAVPLTPYMPPIRETLPAPCRASRECSGAACPRRASRVENASDTRNIARARVVPALASCHRPRSRRAIARAAPCPRSPCRGYRVDQAFSTREARRGQAAPLHSRFVGLRRGLTYRRHFRRERHGAGKQRLYIHHLLACAVGSRIAGIFDARGTARASSAATFTISTARASSAPCTTCS